MSEHKTEISGKAMAVLIGTICLIGPWFSEIGVGYKLLVAIIGVTLIILGTR